MNKPKSSSEFAEKQLDKAADSFDKFQENIAGMTMDHMNKAPLEENEPQTKLSDKEMKKIGDTYLKPVRTIGCRDKFNENFRAQYEFDKEYVQFTAENLEIIGETIDLWTRPYAGLPAEEWKVPVNKPVWGPRYLAEQIRSKVYHRLIMGQTASSSDGMGTYFESMAVDKTIARLAANPVISRKSVFMGAHEFK